MISFAMGFGLACAFPTALVLSRKRTMLTELTEQQREKFWAKVQITDGCWPWLGHINRNGYGEFHSAGDRRLAHVLAFEEEYSPVPAGLFVCHSCDVRHCVNYEHLFLGTCEDNWNDMREKGRHAKGEQQADAKVTEEDVAYMRRFRSDGITASAIAQWYGLSLCATARLLSGRTWRHVDARTDFSINTHAKGSKVHTAKLSEKQIPEIRNLCRSGIPMEILAQRYGVQRQTIRAIMTGRNWKHVP